MTRICKYCDCEFETEQRHSKVCCKCKKEKHQEKIMKTLHLL